MEQSEQSEPSSSIYNINNKDVKFELYNGDCVEILQNINIEKSVIVTDPPFNIGYHYNSYNDSLPEEEYYSWLVKIFSGRPHVVIHYAEQLYKYSHCCGILPTKVISWVYNSNTAKQHRDICFFNIVPDFRKCGQPYKNPKDKRIMERIARGEEARLYDWWEINQVKNVSKEKTEHPCQMPLEVMLRIVKILPDDYVIIDPFMGSGTTGVACKQVGKSFIGIERDNKYYEISKQRISTYERD